MSARATPAQTAGRQGHFAGGVSRLVAFALDLGISWGLYTLGAGALSLTVGLITGTRVTLNHHPLAAGLVLGVWEFLYFAYQWGMAGKTIGMALLGLKVVQTDGSHLGFGRAFLRTLVFPLSFLFFGLGFLGILTNRQRHAWHDGLAHTSVVYDWDARGARLRWLARQEPALAATAPPRPPPA
jgi:uncharacterized RDD family membrane protein YckC